MAASVSGERERPGHDAAPSRASALLNPSRRRSGPISFKDSSSLISRPIATPALTRATWNSTPVTPTGSGGAHGTVYSGWDWCARSIDRWLRMEPRRAHGERLQRRLHARTGGDGERRQLHAEEGGRRSLPTPG